MYGVIKQFDAHKGLGEVACERGQVLMFHCAQIADGSRTIAVGTRVEFEILRKFSRNEGSDIRPL